jgi:hypothetical protein
MRDELFLYRKAASLLTRSRLLKTKRMKPMNHTVPGGGFGRLVPVWAALVVAVCCWPGNGLAKPRPPLPPVPELAPVLFHENFDEPFSRELTDPELTVPDYGTLRESWSGYALQRAGPSAAPFVVPAADLTGRRNVADDGIIRFWVRPYWTSAGLDQGATGPGVNGRLLELVALGGKQTAVIWSLVVTRDGAALVLLGPSDAEPVVLLQAEIGWLAGQWHLVTLDYSAKATALLLDGQLAAEGAGTLAVPPSVAQLVVGSTWQGRMPRSASWRR